MSSAAVTRQAPQAFRELVVMPKAEEAFKRLGLDLTKLRQDESRIQKQMDQITQVHTNAERYIVLKKGRVDNEMRVFATVQEEHTRAFVGELTRAEKDFHLDPARTEAAVKKAEEYEKAQSTLQEKHLKSFTELKEAAIHELDEFDIKVAKQANDLSLSIQKRFDDFVVGAEKKLVGVQGPEREQAAAEIHKQAALLIREVSNDVVKFLSTAKKEQEGLVDSIRGEFSATIEKFKQESTALFIAQEREKAGISAGLKLGGQEFERLSPDQKMAFCDPKEIRQRMDGTLKLLSAHAPEALLRKESIHQLMTVDELSLERVFNNARIELSRFSLELAEDSVVLCAGFLEKQHENLRTALKKGELGHVGAHELDGLMQDCVQKLVFQDFESRKRQLGDHGVRHILGNIEMQEKIFDAVNAVNVASDQVTSFGKFMAAVVQVNHDMGYAVDVAIKSTSKIASAGTEVQGSDKYHPEHGQKIFDEDFKSKFFAKIFTDDQLKGMSDMILTHDGNMRNGVAAAPSVSLDWTDAPIASAVRLSDNMALFAPYKLPSLFQHVTGAPELLIEMREARLAGNDQKSKELKDQLIELVKKMPEKSDDPSVHCLSWRMKRDLIHAAEDVTSTIDKFALGMFAGDINDIGCTQQGTVSVSILYDPAQVTLQGAGFIVSEQRQFTKFAESYGITLQPGQASFDITEPTSGQVLLHVEVVTPSISTTTGQASTQATPTAT